MRCDRLALVADDRHLGLAIQAHVGKVIDRRTPLYPFAGVRDHLRPPDRSLLLCAAGSAADADQVVRLVQDVRLRQWGSTVLVLETPDAARDRRLARHERFLDCRLEWPGEADLLVALLRFAALTQRDRADGEGGPRPGPAAREEPAKEALLRELLRQTPSLEALAAPLALAASHDMTVLLTGETGTGKTHLARMIHEHSPRRGERLTVVPCGALASDLIESELFGHARGAFTGADRAKVGRFEAAGSGTILLDEIDALSAGQQARLLRVLETGEFEPVGSNETRRCRARILAASNVDLEEAVRQGKFRQDLYYRLNVLPLHLPPLRERRQDIAPLARNMAASYGARFNRDLFDLDPDALEALQAFPWPGNVRQLQNVIQRAVLLSKGPVLRCADLPDAVRGAAAPAPAAAAPPATTSLAEDRVQNERAALERALAEANQCRSKAARSLGISRVTLYHKMKKYGIQHKGEVGARRPQA
jgi:DNA-binding NtrC family response regulator